MRKYLFIWLVFVFGFFSIPDMVVACEKSTEDVEHSCCSDKSEHHSDEKSCCDDTKSEHQQHCAGSCHCPTMVMQMLVGKVLTFENKVDFELDKKVFSPVSDTVSASFYSIWQPPKIA